MNPVKNHESSLLVKDYTVKHQAMVFKLHIPACYVNSPQPETGLICSKPMQDTFGTDYFR